MPKHQMVLTKFGNKLFQTLVYNKHQISYVNKSGGISNTGSYSIIDVGVKKCNSIIYNNKAVKLCKDSIIYNGKFERFSSSHKKSAMLCAKGVVNYIVDYKLLYILSYSVVFEDSVVDFFEGRKNVIVSDICIFCSDTP